MISDITNTAVGNIKGENVRDLMINSTKLLEEYKKEATTRMENLQRKLTRIEQQLIYKNLFIIIFYQIIFIFNISNFII